MTDRTDATRPLAGVRIIEISSFVAVPLAGMTLAQLGAEVIRVDPVGGAADYHRWPVTDGGDSIYWAGLNKGKRSVAVDVRSEEGQRLIARLIARQWHPDHQCGRAPMAFVRHAGRVAPGPDPRRGVRTRRRRHRCRLHRQRGPRLPARHRSRRPRRSGQPRAARMGRRVRHLRRARRHRRAAAPRRHRARASGSASRWRTSRSRRRATSASSPR